MHLKELGLCLKVDKFAEVLCPIKGLRKIEVKNLNIPFSVCFDTFKIGSQEVFPFITCKSVWI